MNNSDFTSTAPGLTRRPPRQAGGVDDQRARERAFCKTNILLGDIRRTPSASDIDQIPLLTPHRPHLTVQNCRLALCRLMSRMV